MKKTKKALASLAIAGMTLSMIPFNVFAAAPTQTRIAGVTAEQTAVQIADQTGYTGTAVLASSTSYGMVDALTAGPLAASLKAPILLTGAGSTLNADTKAELTKLAVKKVYVTSGTAVIKQGVIDELKGMGIEVVALGGFDRAETSVNIAKQMTGVTKVAVANGIPDALSIASVAAAANEPILLTDKDALPASVAAYLAANAGITASDVIGGTGVISDAVVAGLPGATRHFGMTAYDTNNKVIQDFAAGLKFDNVYVANGVTGIDALAGAPLAAQTNSAIVLTDGKSVPAAAAFTYSKSSVNAVTTALGGEAVVPEAVRSGIAAGKVTPDTNEMKIVSVSALNDANSVLELVFSKPLTKLEISDVSVQNANSLARYGVKSVVLASSGLIATVELYSHDDADQADPVLAYLTNYTFTVNANGSTIKATFNRPAYQKARITNVDPIDRKIVVNAVTINIPASYKFDFQAALGAKVRAWYNVDKDLVNIAFEDEKPVTGKLEVTKTRVVAAGVVTEKGKVEIDGVEYVLSSSDDLVFDRNDTLGGAIGVDGTEYDYAKAFFNKNGEIERIVSYDFDGFFVVKSTDADVAISYDDDELDLEDYIIFKDGKSITVNDLKEGDIVYYENASNDGDGIAEVYNKSVSGEIETVYSDKIKVGGTNYTWLNGRFGTAKYLDDDTFKTLDGDQAEEFQAGGPVTAYLDRYGKVVYIKGTEGTVASDTTSAYNVKALLAYIDNAADKGTIDLDLVTEAGDKVAKSLHVNNLDKVTVTNAAGVSTDYEVDEVKPGTAVEIDEFRLVANAGNMDLYAYNSAGAQIGGAIVANVAASAGLDKLVKYTVDDSGAVVGLEFIASVAQGATDLELDDNYVSTGAGKFRLQSDTVVYDASEGFVDANNNGVLDGGEFDPDADDITVTTWGALADAGFKVLESDVYVDDDANVDYLVIKQTDSSDKTDFNAVITSVLRNTDNKVVEIKALVDGSVKTYEVDEITSAIVKGQSVVLTINDDSELVEGIKTGVAAPEVVTGTVTAINLADKKVTVNGVQYNLISGGEIYDAEDPSDITEEQFREIAVNDVVDILLDEAGTFNAEVITMKGADVAAPTVTSQMTAAGTITANGTHTLVFSEALNAASKTAVKTAVDAAFTEAGAATVSSAWSVDGKTLTVTIAGLAASPADDVTLAAIANIAVTDVAGNTSALLDVQQ